MSVYYSICLYGVPGISIVSDICVVSQISLWCLWYLYGISDVCMASLASVWRTGCLCGVSGVCVTSQTSVWYLRCLCSVLDVCVLSLVSVWCLWCLCVIPDVCVVSLASVWFKICDFMIDLNGRWSFSFLTGIIILDLNKHIWALEHQFGCQNYLKVRAVYWNVKCHIYIHLFTCLMSLTSGWHCWYLCGVPDAFVTCLASVNISNICVIYLAWEWCL